MDLIDSQLSHKAPDGSNNGSFARGSSFEKGSTTRSGKQGQEKVKVNGPNKNMTCNCVRLKAI